MFFDKYDRFYDTSETAANADRLNLRFEAIFDENRDIFDGARVLDIASHDGRWSLAALASGAESVVGIEARPELAEQASATPDHYGYGSDRARFIAGDVHEVLLQQEFDVDVVLCLGFLYHTLRYNELMHGIRRANPKHIVLDTQARRMFGAEPVIFLNSEVLTYQGNAVADEHSYGTRVLTGRPNLNAIRRMMQSYDYEVEAMSNWREIILDNLHMKRSVGDYAVRKRLTIRCVDTRRC